VVPGLYSSFRWKILASVHIFYAVGAGCSSRLSRFRYHSNDDTYFIISQLTFLAFCGEDEACPKMDIKHSFATSGDLSVLCISVYVSSENIGLEQVCIVALVLTTTPWNMMKTYWITSPIEPQKNILKTRDKYFNPNTEFPSGQRVWEGKLNSVNSDIGWFELVAIMLNYIHIQNWFTTRLSKVWQ
jgi:hypothetical protein